MREIIIMDCGNGSERRYQCQHDWDETCGIQGGDMGSVFTDKTTYQTSFFEAFPQNIETYFRGEGKTMEEAENDAWRKYQKVLHCPEHDYERRENTSGVGYCQHCNLQKNNAFEPEQYCEVCQAPTNWAKSQSKKWYCKEHKHCIPEEDKTDLQKGLKVNPFKLLFESLD